MAVGLLYEMMRRLSNITRSSPTLLDEAGWLQGLQGRKEVDSIEKTSRSGTGTVQEQTPDAKTSKKPEVNLACDVIRFGSGTDPVIPQMFKAHKGS
jgi:hypothetical protein